MGYMGIVDIEGKKAGGKGAEGGSTHLDTEQNEGMGESFGAEGQTALLMDALKVGALAVFAFVATSKLMGHIKASESNVIDNMNAEEGPHWWHQ